MRRFLLVLAAIMVSSVICSTLNILSAGLTRASFVNPLNTDPGSWPMFHSDLRHTGYSPSEAPDTVSTPLWSYQTGYVVYSSPAVADGKVFVGSTDDKVYALDESTGSFKWSYTTSGTIRSSPAVVGGRVFVGSEDGNVYALDEFSGAFRWSYSTGSQGSVCCSPAVADGKVFIGSDGFPTSVVYAISQSSGALIWQYQTSLMSLMSSPAVVDSRVFIGSCDNKLYALDESTGALLWSYTTGSSIYSSPAVSNGKVFVGSNDGSLYALDEVTGAFGWMYTTGGGVYSSPAVADGKVFVGSYDGKIYALDESTGSFKWSYTTGPIYCSSPAVADGKVFVGSYDYNIYAFGEAAPPASDFSIGAYPTSLTIQQGGLDTSAITIQSIGSFSQPVQLSVFGTPTGTTATLNPQQVTPPAGGSISSTLTISVSTTTPASYTMTVTGACGALSHSAQVTVIVTTPPITCGKPVLVSPVQISSNGGYSVGDTLTARFTIQNQGTAAIHLDKLLFGGRFNYGGTLPGGGFPDFTFRTVTLQVGQTYQYEGTLYLTEAGHYEFFVAYYIANPTEAEKQLLHLDPSNWNPCIDLAPGLTDNDRTWQRSISDWTPAPQTIPIIGKGIWITYIWNIEGGGNNLQRIIDRLTYAKIRWVSIKLGDGDYFWLETSPSFKDWANQYRTDPLHENQYDGFANVIKRFHEKGIRVLGTHFAYSYDYWNYPGVTELDVANKILDRSLIRGLDGLLIDAERELDGTIDGYRTYITALHNAHLNDFIAYTSFDDAQGSFREQLHALFTTYCDASMPQVYWTPSGRPTNRDTPNEELEYMEKGIGKRVNGKWVDRWHEKPIMPMGISGPDPTLPSREVYEGEIKAFCDTSFAHGYSAVSLFAYHITFEDCWTEYSGCFNPDTTIRGQCPIDLVVTDPDGLIINRTLNEVPGALYTESDPNGHNDTVIEVSIIHRKLGDYFLTVIPRPNASSNDTYSLDFSTLNMTTTLAQNTSISDIPSESYAVTLTETAIVPRTEAHDIGIDRFSALKTFIGQDKVASLDVKVRNYGDEVEHFNLTLYLNLSMIANLENITLASRDSFLTTFKWNTTGLSRGSYTINAVCSCVEGESYVDDNLKSLSIEITILGDINGDRKVDVKDVYAVAKAYGTSIEGPNPPDRDYSLYCDINGDDKIDVKDYYVVCRHYGEVDL